MGEAELSVARHNEKDQEIARIHKMKNTTPAASPVDPDLQVLHLYAGQAIAECPHCKGELSEKMPILKGDENEKLLGRGAVLVAMRMATDPRPKCPHCYGRFEVVVHFSEQSPTVTRQNEKDQEIPRRHHQGREVSPQGTEGTQVPEGQAGLE